MAFRTACVALLLSCLPIAGCGTVANLARHGSEEGGKVPFGGVIHDLQSIQEAGNGEQVSTTPLKLRSGQTARVEQMLLCVDLPFSLIGDVVTWPYTWAYSVINQPTDYPPITIADPAYPPITIAAPPVTPAPAEDRPQPPPPSGPPTTPDKPPDKLPGKSPGTGVP